MDVTVSLKNYNAQDTVGVITYPCPDVSLALFVKSSSCEV